MFFINFLIFAHSIHVGIDVGSSFTKSAFSSLSETPEIGYNYDSKRTTPSYIAFRAPSNFTVSKENPLTNEEAAQLIPSFGDKALSIIEIRPHLGSGHMQLFIDLNESETERLSQELLINSTAAKFSFSDLLTLYFKLYIECISHGKKVTSVTLSVPSHFTLPQRRILESAVNRAGFICLPPIDDVDSIAHVYSFEKTNKFTSQPKTVLFIDVGATTLTSFAIKFEIQKDKNKSQGKAIAHKLSYEIQRENGGSFLTISLANYIKNKLNLVNLSISENRRLMSVAEKLKIQLTILKSASSVVEDIQGEDKEITVTREELEELSKPLINDLIQVAKKASEGIEFDEIELLGGSSRLPIVISSLKEAFNVTFIGHSLNADESFAIGSVYYSQTYNNVSRFSPLEIDSNYSFYTIYGTYGNETYELCRKNNKCINELKLNIIPNTTFYNSI